MIAAPCVERLGDFNRRPGYHAVVRKSTVEAILRALNEASVRYLIAGGLAVVAHGYVRFTADVDLILDLESGNVRRALHVFSGLGYRPRAPVPLDQFAEPDHRERWVAEKGLTVFSMYSSASPETEIDLFVRCPTDFERAYSSALRLEFAPGVSGTFLGRDDLIAIKTQAGRPKDLLDVAELKKAWKGSQRA